MRILIVEDESKVARFLSRGLQNEGYESVVAENGALALELLRAQHFDIATVDLSLPEMDGITLLEKMRHEHIRCLTLVLSARGNLTDRLVGFDAGADDYLPKPFAFEELLARLKALLRRRTELMESTELTYADIHMDLLTRTVRRQQKTIELTSREFALLEYLLLNPERILLKSEILRAVWPDERSSSGERISDSNVLEVYMMYLRRKLELDGEPMPIRTVRRLGYILSTTAT